MGWSTCHQATWGGSHTYGELLACHCAEASQSLQSFAKLFTCWQLILASSYTPGVLYLSCFSSHADVAIRKQDLPFHVCLSLVLDVLARMPAEGEQAKAAGAAVLLMAAWDSRTPVELHFLGCAH